MKDIRDCLRNLNGLYVSCGGISKIIRKKININL